MIDLLMHVQISKRNLAQTATVNNCAQ